MPYVDPEFTVPTIPQDEKYEGTEVDDNVRKVLPEGSKILWVATHGASFWAISTKIDTELIDGTKQSYFMKVYITPKGHAQAVGEYLSTQALHAVIPDNVPRPVAVGALARDSSKHFLICEFVDMVEEMPPVAEFASVIAQLHKNSQSPNAKFGFDVPTSQSLQLANAWCDTWEEFFTRAFRGTVKLEQEIQGHNPELERLARQDLREDHTSTTETHGDQWAKITAYPRPWRLVAWQRWHQSYNRPCGLVRLLRILWSS